MDFTSSAATGGLRVALQVLTSFKRPVLEVYEQLRNVSGPPVELAPPDSSSATTHRFQDSFVDITLVNVGGVRAENLRIGFAGNTEMLPAHKVPRMLQDGCFSKWPPGHAALLLKLQSYDIEKATSGFQLTITYDGPNEGLGRVHRAWSRFRKRPQYSYVYSFDPALYSGAHLPSPEYNG